jgi:hypothetical protein
MFEIDQNPSDSNTSHDHPPNRRIASVDSQVIDFNRINHVVLALRLDKAISRRPKPNTDYRDESNFERQEDRQRHSSSYAIDATGALRHDQITDSS